MILEKQKTYKDRNDKMNAIVDDESKHLKRSKIDFLSKQAHWFLH